jgi:MFS family permease
MKLPSRPTGMTAFLVIWIGQIISILASAMSQFGLTIWMYQQTQSATAMGLMQVFFLAPFLLMSPLAGVMVDRYNRKIMMMISDLTAVTATFGIFLLYASGHLQFWHLYVAAALNGIGNTFQWPAYSAAISTMIPREQLGRANGLTALMESGPGVLAPALAGALMPVIGLTGLLFFDFATFFVAIGALLLVIIPATPPSDAGHEANQGSLVSQATFGFKYIFARPSLLGLQFIFFFGNLFGGIAYSVLAPMLLARSGQNSMVFGTVQSVLAGAGIAGAIIMSAWGGFKRRVYGVLLGWTIASLGTILLGFGKSLALWIPAAILAALFTALIDGSNQAIWQSKVPADIQGRVFSARRMIAWFTGPLAPIIAGTLADFVLEPAMRTTNNFSTAMSHLVGSGPGSGMSLLIIICGVAGFGACLVGYSVSAIRNVENILPDAPNNSQPG